MDTVIDPSRILVLISPDLLPHINLRSFFLFPWLWIESEFGPMAGAVVSFPLCVRGTDCLIGSQLPPSFAQTME